MRQAVSKILPNLQTVWQTKPPIFTPDTSLSMAIAQMYPIATSCFLARVSQSARSKFSYAIAIEDNAVVGTIDELDCLKATINHSNWHDMSLQDIMSPPEIVRSSSEARDFLQVVSRLERASRSHLVIVDDRGELARYRST